MQQNKKQSIFEPALTPYNAGEKGYFYIDDIIYDLLNPNETMMDMLHFINEFQWKLGTPKEDMSMEPYFGLYIPLKR